MKNFSIFLRYENTRFLSLHMSTVQTCQARGDLNRGIPIEIVKNVTTSVPQIQ